MRAEDRESWKTPWILPEPDSRTWYIIDCQDVYLGRLATEVAYVLAGKNDPTYSPGADTGAQVVVVNALGVRVTGKKVEQKQYYRYTGYPGGLRSRSLKEMMERSPEQVIRLAVKGMLHRNKLRKRRLARLHVCLGADHPYAAQKPSPLPIRSPGRFKKAAAE